jgi:AcrR family transcriptional regulator
MNRTRNPIRREPKPRPGKQGLVDAAVRLVARAGPEGVTVREITEAAGVTEAALYRHFRSKSEMYLEIYEAVLEDMIREKTSILAAPGSTREKLHAWVRASYATYDRNPAAFTFVLLCPPELPVRSTKRRRRQSELLLGLLRGARARGELRDMDPEVLLSHFVGVMLSIPARINEGALPGPAGRYADEVARAAWGALRRDDG